MEKYLQIPLALYTTFVATFGWDMTLHKTVYKDNNGDDIYVTDGRWVDSMGLQDLPAHTIKTDLANSRVNIVYLDSTAFAR